MALWNFQNFLVKKETVKWEAEKATKALKVEWVSINSKINTRRIEQIEGKTFSPSTLIKGTIETGWTVDFFADRENLVYFLAMMSNAPTPTNNADGTYTYSYDIENSYGLPSFSTETRKDILVERDAWIVGSKLDLSIDNEVLKGSLEVIWMKSLTSLKIVSKDVNDIVLNWEVDNFVVWDLVLKNWVATAITITRKNEATKTLTLSSWTSFSAWDIIWLVKQTAVYTDWVIPFRFFEKTTVKLADSIANLASATATWIYDLWVTLTNENTGVYLSWSNFRNRVNQGMRKMEGKFSMYTENENIQEEYNAFQTLTKRAIEITFEGENIGSGSAKELFTIKGMIQYKEGPLDIKSGEFLTVPFTFDFISDITISIKSTIASI